MKYFVSVLLLLIASTGLADEQSKNSELNSSLFGGGGGYIHPYITIGGLYDDNVYNGNNDTQSDTALVVSPGIWLAFPATREKVLNLETTNLTPGGLRLVEDRGRRFKRMQGYLHYGGDFTRYNDAVDTDTDDHRVEGYFFFDTKGGLSLEVFDFYLDGHNDWSTGVSEELDTFKSNLIGGRATYNIGSKFRLRAAYTNYLVDYDQDRNKNRDRQDNKIATWLYYKISSKSSIFLEYDYLDIEYDTADYLNSKEHHIYSGLRWRLTGKTMGEVKLGYLFKDFNDSRLESDGDFILSAWTDYDFSRKTSLKLLVDQTYEEPSSYTLESILSSRIRITGRHKLTDKFYSTCTVGYKRSSYNGLYIYESVASEREDDEYQIKFSLNYQIQKWLGLKASYEYFKRDSTIGELSYIDNRVLFSVAFEM